MPSCAYFGKGKVVAPGRIHLTVPDMNRFAPDRAGGDGAGFALQIYCSAEVECTAKEITIEYTREPIIRHFVMVFCKTVGYKEGFKIKIVDHEKKHVGLGSTGSVLLALGHAMNTALGGPLTSDQIRRLLGNNCVEEIEDGRVTRGLRRVWSPQLQPLEAWSSWAMNWHWLFATALGKERMSSSSIHPRLSLPPEDPSSICS